MAKEKKEVNFEKLAAELSAELAAVRSKLEALERKGEPEPEFIPVRHKDESAEVFFTMDKPGVGVTSLVIGDQTWIKMPIGSEDSAWFPVKQGAVVLDPVQHMLNADYIKAVGLAVKEPEYVDQMMTDSWEDGDMDVDEGCDESPHHCSGHCSSSNRCRTAPPVLSAALAAMLRDCFR